MTGAPLRLAIRKMRLGVEPGTWRDEAGDLDRVSALFLDMHALALRSTPGANLDVAPAFGRLGEISAPTLVIWGDLEFPHIQERCRHVAVTVLNGSGHELAGAAHLPSLERPADVTGLRAEFIDRCPGCPP